METERSETAVIATIQWSKHAQRDRIIVRMSLENFNLHVALDFEDSLKRAVKTLRVFPAIGRPGRLPDTRYPIPENWFLTSDTEPSTV